METVYIGADENHVDARPVQWVIRPHSDKWHDFRGFAGVLPVVSSSQVMPSRSAVRLRDNRQGIHEMGTELDEAFAPMSVALTLNDEIDISRGDMIVKPNNHLRRVRMWRR